MEYSPFVSGMQWAERATAEEYGMALIIPPAAGFSYPCFRKMFRKKQSPALAVNRRPVKQPITPLFSCALFFPPLRLVLGVQRQAHNAAHANQCLIVVGISARTMLSFLHGITPPFHVLSLGYRIFMNPSITFMLRM
jgi:hypothetical protein